MGLILEALLCNNTGIQFSFALRMAQDIIEAFRGGFPITLGRALNE
jgi:hypothetical protein